MKAMIILVIGLCTTSCTISEDGVRQCEDIIRSPLSASSFYKRLPNEIGDLNTAHPDIEANYDQRSVSINYESKNNQSAPVAHRYECVFKLNNGRVGPLVTSGFREPRLLDYGKRALPVN